MNKSHKKRKGISNINIELDIFKNGFEYICGIDEVGYGSLAGPVCIGCVLVKKCNLEKLLKMDIDDSKKLNKKQRKKLFRKIIENSFDWSICFVSNKIIDKINIKQATLLGAKTAIKLLNKSPDYILIDGINKIKYLRIPQRSIVKGDEKSIAIASASIVAKVLRDRFMIKLNKQFRRYKFNKNKGYGTRYHIEALEKYGKTTIHREKFIDSII